MNLVQFRQPDDLALALVAAEKALTAIPYYPTAQEEAREAILRGISAFVRNAAELTWLIGTAIACMRKWGGVAELRALYCTRFTPADRIAGGPCSLPGYTPNDCEAENQARIAGQLLLPAPEDSPVTDAERAQWAALARRIKLGAAKESQKKWAKRTRYEAPRWLKELYENN